ncbi:hypothetical protein KU900_000681 [Salmonella enterica subsp. enterica serovar Virchow]|nr:hypothetical protein [Salmonella enterica subsp. enterica serovar Virchow]
MLDSLPDAALPFWAYKSRCLKIGRKWRRQIIHGLRAASPKPSPKKSQQKLAKIILEAM